MFIRIKNYIDKIMGTKYRFEISVNKFSIKIVIYFWDKYHLVLQLSIILVQSFKLH